LTLETQPTAIKLAFPSTTEMGPGEVLSSATPTLSWKMVKDIYKFQVHVYDITDGRPAEDKPSIYFQDVREIWVYYGGEPKKPVVTHTIPAGTLKPGRTYAWRVVCQMSNYSYIGSTYRYFQIR